MTRRRASRRCTRPSTRDPRRPTVTASTPGRSSSTSPHFRDGQALAKQLRGEGLPVKRHFRTLLVGASSEDEAVDLGERLEQEAPEGSRIGVRGNPDDMPLPAFVNLSALKPGFLRDFGL